MSRSKRNILTPYKRVLLFLFSLFSLSIATSQTDNCADLFRIILDTNNVNRYETILEHITENKPKYCSHERLIHSRSELDGIEHFSAYKRKRGALSVIAGHSGALGSVQSDPLSLVLKFYNQNDSIYGEKLILKLIQQKKKDGVDWVAFRYLIRNEKLYHNEVIFDAMYKKLSFFSKKTVYHHEGAYYRKFKEKYLTEKKIKKDPLAISDIIKTSFKHRDTATLFQLLDHVNINGLYGYTKDHPLEIILSEYSIYKNNYSIALNLEVLKFTIDKYYNGSIAVITNDGRTPVNRMLTDSTLFFDLASYVQNWKHLDNHGNSYLHFAVKYDAPIVVITYLCEKGLGAQLPNDKGETPITLSGKHADPNVKKLMTKYIIQKD
ncbi:MAG: ankyrin repeat domain-containing protein [Flavobacteriales bacterium]|nr:ankyrin repeat domain-containing protein [Flavobacteriales bacterium]